MLFPWRLWQLARHRYFQRPDSNKVATALEALMHELNQEKARLLGDGPILSFALASSVNMNSLDTDPLTEEFWGYAACWRFR